VCVCARDTTVNQLLSELDGFEAGQQVCVCVWVGGWVCVFK